MRPKPKPGFLLVARRECRWLLHDRAALILIFGVPLFAFAVLTAVFSHPVIRELGVVIVDADRSETSRAFVEEVEASPGLSIAERAGDLGSAARAIRSGEAIAAVYVPADFERDLKAGRRPQVVGFYNRQFLTAAGIASSGLGDSLSAAAKRAAERAAPKASRIGSLVAETIVLVNPQRNYAQFLLRALLPMVVHVIIAISGGYAVGSEFHRRSMRTWLACAGGNPIVALAGKLAPLFGIFFVIMLLVPIMAARARDPWCFHPACGWAGGLRRLLPAALSQPDPAQDPDRGRRQRPQRVEQTHCADAGRKRRRQSGHPR